MNTSPPIWNFLRLIPWHKLCRTTQPGAQAENQYSQKSLRQRISSREEGKCAGDDSCQENKNTARCWGDGSWMMHMLSKCKDLSSNPQNPHKGRYSTLISKNITPVSKWKTETGEQKLTQAVQLGVDCSKPQKEAVSNHVGSKAKHQCFL